MSGIHEFPSSHDRSSNENEKVGYPPLLDAFLKPSSDIAEFNQWTTTLYERTLSVIEGFDKKFGERWAALVTSPLLGNSYSNSIFKPELYCSEESVQHVRLLSLQVMLLGFEGKRNADWDNLVPAIAAKFATHPYINPVLVSNDSVSGKLDSFVTSCIVAGVDLYENTKDMTAIAASTQAKTPVHQQEWKPGAWGDFINGLDIDDFTGKRP